MNPHMDYTTNGLTTQDTSSKKLAAEWQLTIDPDLRDLLPNNPERVKMLEAQIIEEGCRDPIVVWLETGVIVDGNTRHDICLRNGIPFSIVRMSFSCKSEAMQWAKDNQSNRRNMTKPELIEIATKIESVIREEAKARKVTSTGGKSPQLRKNFNEAEKGRSDDELGAMAGVSAITYRKGAHIIKNAPEPIKQAWKSETLSTDAAYQATKAAPEAQEQIIKGLEEGKKKPKNVVRDVLRNTTPQKKEEKQMQSAAVMEPAPAYNIDDLIGEILSNGDDYVRSLRTHIEMRLPMFKDDAARERVQSAIDTVIDNINKMKGEFV